MILFILSLGTRWRCVDRTGNFLLDTSFHRTWAGVPSPVPQLKYGQPVHPSPSSTLHPVAWCVGLIKQNDMFLWCLPNQLNTKDVIMRFVIRVVFYEITNVQCVYSPNTTIFIVRIYSIFYIRYNYMFRRLIMSIFRLNMKYLLSSSCTLCRKYSIFYQ